MATPTSVLQPSPMRNKTLEARPVTLKEKKNCWADYLEKNPNMKIWAEANPGAAAQAKKRFDDC